MNDKNSPSKSRYNILKDKFIQKTLSFKNKALNLIRTNYELGLFHLYKHNIKDAIFRFKLVLYFHPDHLLAKYYLAISLYIQNNSISATHILNTLNDQNNHFKPAQYLLNFFNDLTTPQELDVDLTKGLFNSLIDESYYDNNMIPVYQNMTNMVLNHLKDTEKKLNILDIGSGTGQCFSIFKDHLKISKSTSIDFAEQAISNTTKQNLYTTNICDDFQSFTVRTSEKFDLIIVDSVLHYYKDFSTQLKAIKSLLAPSGLIIFTIEQSPTNTHVNFNYTLTNLCFNKTYINKMINDAKIHLLKIDSYKTTKQSTYICLCTQES